MKKADFERLLQLHPTLKRAVDAQLAPKAPEVPISARSARKSLPPVARSYDTPLLRVLLTGKGIPAPVFEHRFCDRKWRMDMAWPDAKVFVEVNGGIWMKKGAHNTGVAMLRDMDKFSTAASLGWRLLVCQPSDLTGEKFLTLLKAALEYGK